MPNTSELSKLEREKFKLVPSSVDKIDHILNVITKRNNIEFLNRKNLICKIYDQKCFIFYSGKFVGSDQLSL